MHTNHTYYYLQAGLSMKGERGRERAARASSPCHLVGDYPNDDGAGTFSLPIFRVAGANEVKGGRKRGKQMKKIFFSLPFLFCGVS